MLRLAAIFLAIILPESAKADEDVVEHLHFSVRSLPDLGKHSVFSDIKTNEISDILMRGKDGEGSSIILKDGELSNEWSVSFRLQPPKLIDVERASFQLWYTVNEFRKGEFKGGSHDFRGWMGGIEFNSRGVELFYVENYGVLKDKSIERGVHRNKMSIQQMEEMTIKIIRSENNMKIEIYDGERLIDDSFRDYSKWGGSGDMHLAVTSHYEKCPGDKVIILKEIGMWDRKEGKSYKMMDYQKELNRFPRRASGEEVRYAVAQLRHFMRYTEFVLGNDENELDKFGVSLKDKIREKKIAIDNLVIQEKLSDRLDNKKVLESEEKRLSALSLNLDKMHNELKTLLNDIKVKNTDKDTNYVHLVGLLVGIFGLMFVVRKLIEASMNRKAGGKRE